MKKAFSLLLSLVMLLSITSALDFAAYADESEYYTYKVYNEEAIITHCDRSIKGDITIPSELGGYSVTGIGDWVFYGCSNLKNITIPNSVTSIGNNAFSHCGYLESINVDQSNENYYSEDGVLFNNSKTILIRLPEGYTKTKYIIPNGVISIAKSAFSNSKNLRSITIPDSVTSIGDWAFSNCDSLGLSYQYGFESKCITIPDSVTSIGDWVFSNCGSLTTITIPNSLTSIGDFAFSGCRSLTSITIPNSVTSIGNNAFLNCYNLKSITIPDLVTSIGDWSFSNCYNLTSITIPNGVISIGNNAFSDCDSLTTITIPNSVTSIGNNAFSDCNSLTTITISNSVTSIDEFAFYECTRLSEVYYNSTIADWNKISIGDENLCLKNAIIHCIDGLINEEKHYWNDGEITKPSSCTENGIKTYTCTECGASYTDTIDKIAHTPEIDEAVEPTCTTTGLTEGMHCLICNEVLIEQNVINALDHSFTNYVSDNNATCTKDGTKTAKCDRCDITDTVTDIGSALEHTEVISKQAVAPTCDRTGLTEEISCSVCGYLIKAQKVVKTTGHNYKSVITTPATCSEVGVETFTCTICEDSYTETIDKITHTYETIITRASASDNENGSIVIRCAVCGNVSKNTVINYPKTITLSKTSYTYTGKSQEPTVTVKDSKGNKIAESNYTVRYTNNKNVGTATATITFKGNYSGSKTLYFTIAPEATTLSSVTAKSKGFTVKWKKQATQTTGYQIQYSTDKNFKKNSKTVTISKNSTTSKTISKLSAKKKYYVRVRTYKTVKVNGKNTKFYSSWSKAKAVTTKK